MRFRGLLHIYWFAAVATVIIWGSVYWSLGVSALFTVIVLTLLETTFSADNVVMNGKILSTMSPAWQRIFMTAGIIIAVFFVRFLLPIVIVTVGARLGFGTVLNLALHHPKLYSKQLIRAEPAIDAFGGTFLLLVALNYFVDYEKSVHWIGPIERRMGKLGKIEHINSFITLGITLLLYVTVGSKYQNTVLFAAIAALALHAGLGLLDSTAGAQTGKMAVQEKVGMAAFITFMYLEILDASFSLDGVIGAFALTTSIILILAGLGAGAVWVRAMTVHLVRANTLARYIFLEHGAHWAIGFLGTIMLLKLYHIDFPEWFVGSLGLIFIATSISWSKHRGQKTLKI